MTGQILHNDRIYTVFFQLLRSVNASGPVTSTQQYCRLEFHEIFTVLVSVVFLAFLLFYRSASRDHALVLTQ